MENSNDELKFAMDVQDTLGNANRRIGHLVGRIGSEQPAKEQIVDIVKNVIADLGDLIKE